MNKSVHYISLDLVRQQTKEYVHVRTSDTVKVISVMLTESGTPYELTDDTDAVLAAEKPGGTYIYEAAAIAGNRIEVVLPATFTAAAGTLPACFRLTGDGEAAITTPEFEICVSDPAAPDGFDSDLVNVGRVDYMILKS